MSLCCLFTVARCDPRRVLLQQSSGAFAAARDAVAVADTAPGAINNTEKEESMGKLGEESDLTSLTNLGQGAAVERFNDALQTVIENMMDVNTDDKAREIRLVVKFKPNNSRNRCDVSYLVTTKLSPAESLSTQLFVGKAGDEYVASESNLNQLKLDFKPDEAGKVAPLRAVGGEA